MSFELPKLDYAYDALEPAIDARTMEIHHTKHHQAYTTKLNEGLSGTAFENKPIEEVLKNLSELPEAKRQGIRNNGGGFYNHSLFWRILTPESEMTAAGPQGELADLIKNACGSIEDFKAAFEAKGAGQFGSGWAWLVLCSDGSLKVTSTPNQDNPLMATVAAEEQGTPILGVDVWEHAYYLHYQNRRPDYLKAFWSVVNWDRVSENLERAKKGESILC